MTAIMYFLNIFLFTLTCAALGVLLWILPTQQVSETEKRPLSALPQWNLESILSGKYTDSLDKYISDNFPFREPFLLVATEIKHHLGNRQEEIGFYDKMVETGIAENKTILYDSIYKDSILLSDKYITDTIDSQLTNRPQPLSVPKIPDEFTSDNNNETAPAVGRLSMGLLIYKGMAIQMFGGQANSAKYGAECINEYVRKLSHLATVYVGVTPIHGELYLPESYKQKINSEKENINIFNSYLSPAAISFDICSELYAHKEEYLFFNTDHHWTALGAYYAYTAFCKQAGFSPVALESMTAKTIRKFWGSLYRMTLDERLYKNVDSVVYYKPNLVYNSYLLHPPYYNQKQKLPLFAEYAKGGNAYGVFLGGDYPMLGVDTEINNGRRCLVIKNSYGNPFSIYLISHFEKVFIADYRYFTANIIDFVEKNKITDVVILHNSFSANTYGHVNLIKAMLYYNHKCKPIDEPEVKPKLKSTGIIKEATKFRYGNNSIRMIADNK